jgi:hypothetical protein
MSVNTANGDNNGTVVDDLTKRLVPVTLKDMHRHSLLENGRALNALDLPMDDGIIIPEELSSDKWCWRHTIGGKLCKSTDRYPTSAMRWALVSTLGTHSAWHTDTDGLCTKIEIINEEGLKVWFVAVNRANNPGFCNLDTFLDKIDVSKANTDRWDVEAIVLTPGDKL